MAITLSQYISQSIERRMLDPDSPLHAPDNLTIDGALFAGLVAMGKRSENEARELGCLLYFSNSLLKPGDCIYGELNSVQLFSPDTAREPQYIGSFHTHPYRRRWGKNASVGFSMDDLQSYYESFPMGYPLSVHLVLSNRVLHLVIFRHAVTTAFSKKMRRPPHDVIEAENQVLGPRTKRGEKPNERRARYEALSNLSEQLVEERKHEEALNHQRKLVKTFPNYPSTLMEENKKMNEHMAENHDYAYYSNMPLQGAPKNGTLIANLIRRTCGKSWHMSWH